MPNPNQLLAAARALDWVVLERLFGELANKERNERIGWLVSEIRQQGYDICRRDLQEHKNRRDSFRLEFRNYLEREGLSELAESWRSGDAKISAIEWGYHRILASVADHSLPAARQLWATLRHLEATVDAVSKAAMNWRPSAGQAFDPTSLRVKLSDGSHVEPDSYMTTLNEAAAATLKMLALSNGWFRDDGRLILPIPTAASPEDAKHVENVQSLGVIWQTLERSDEHLRFFGGDAKLSVESIQGRAGEPHEVTFLDCLIDGAAVIYDRVAHERRSRMLFQYFTQLNWETDAERQVRTAPPVALPPEAILSLEEAHANISISEILCKAVVEHTNELGGLLIKEWIRGYEALSMYSAERMEGTAVREPCLVLRADLLAYLTQRGLTADKASRFVEAVTHSRKDPDLFDAPLLEVEGGNLYLCPGVASNAHLVEVVMSKLATVRANLEWRGEAFERSVLAMFADLGIAALHIDRNVNGEALEVDCVVFWEGVLFIFECQNVSLSGKSNENVYRFYQTQAHAKEQAERKRGLLLANPVVLEDAFGAKLEISRAVAITLNAMPFGIGEIAEDTYSYDYSALKRFFQERHLQVVMPAAVGSATISRRHGVKSLWSGDAPTALDLIAQMKEPCQFTMAVAQYDWIRIMLPLGKLAGLRTFRSQRNDGGLEADLSAIGVDGQAAAKEVERIQAEFGEQVDELRQKVSGKPTDQR
jgi:hypothetical protein